MPIYEYACEACGHEFEREQRISDDPVKTCPSCRQRKVRRLISQTSFLLKGGGWYKDLYSSSKPAKEAKEAKGDAKEKTPSSESKGSNKGDGKGDGKKQKGSKASPDSGKKGSSGPKAAA